MKKSEINLLLGFIGVLLAFCAYQFVYVKMEEKTAALESQNAQMRTEIAIMEGWIPDREFYETEMDRMHKEISALVREFPANVLPEDDMKLAYQMDNRDSSEYIFVNSMSFTDPAVSYTTTYDTSKADISTVNPIAVEPLYPVYTLYNTQVNMGIDCSYSGIKEMIETIYNKEERKAIDSIVLSFDETTGRLSGNLAMTSYFLYGSDVVYMEPELYEIHKGTDNIFGTVESSEDADAE
ncbi:MAG: hypothetical protein IJ324_08720 [Lachnospiraceae bacterium]|nr:hypothetical protein [Lachnospiraceae bacterium]